jgi:hypothetical protein
MRATMRVNHSAPHPLQGVFGIVNLLETYNVAIAELRALRDPVVANLIRRLEQHR